MGTTQLVLTVTEYEVFLVHPNNTHTHRAVLLAKDIFSATCTAEELYGDEWHVKSVTYAYDSDW